MQNLIKIPAIILPLVVLVLVQVVLLYPDLSNGVNWAYGGDEATYLQLAAKIGMGDFVYPSDHPFVMGQATRYGFIWPLAFMFKLFGVSTSTWAALQLFFVLLLTFFTFDLGRHLFNEVAGQLVVAGLAVLPVVNFMAVRYYPDYFALVYTVGAISLLVRASVRRGWYWYVLSGVFYALAVLTTIKQLLLLPIMVGVFMWLHWGRLKQYLPQLLTWSLGALLCFGAVKCDEYNQTGQVFTQRQVGSVSSKKTAKKGDDHFMENLKRRYIKKWNYKVKDTKRRSGSILLYKFGLLNQFKYGALYYQNFAPYTLVLFVFSIVLFIGICFGSRSNAIGGEHAWSSYLLLLLMICGLYVLYEFVGAISYRKLFRYFLEIPYFITILFYGLYARWIKKSSSLLAISMTMLLIIIVYQHTQVHWLIPPSICAAISVLILGLVNVKFSERLIGIPLIFAFAFLLSIQDQTNSPNFVWRESGLSKALASIDLNKKIYTNSNYVKQGVHYLRDYDNLKNINNFHDINGVSDPQLMYIERGDACNYEPGSYVLLDKIKVQGKRRWQSSNTHWSNLDVSCGELVYNDSRYSCYFIDECYERDAIPMSWSDISGGGKLRYKLDFDQVRKTGEWERGHLALEVDCRHAQFFHIMIYSPNGKVSREVHCADDTSTLVNVPIGLQVDSVVIHPASYINPGSGRRIRYLEGGKLIQSHLVLLRLCI